MTKQRVVVTGLGTINPLGNNVIDTWNNLTSGVSGIDHITLFDAVSYTNLTLPTSDLV